MSLDIRWKDTPTRNADCSRRHSYLYVLRGLFRSFVICRKQITYFGGRRYQFQLSMALAFPHLYVRHQWVVILIKLIRSGSQRTLASRGTAFRHPDRIEILTLIPPAKGKRDGRSELPFADKESYHIGKGPGYFTIPIGAALKLGDAPWFKGVSQLNSTVSRSHSYPREATFHQPTVTKTVLVIYDCEGCHPFIASDKSRTPYTGSAGID
jgi:hypothetical protein